MGDMKPRAWRLALTVAVVAGLAVIPSIWAHDHRVPRTRLYVGGQVKRLTPWSFTWFRAADDSTCNGMTGDGIPTFLPSAEVDHRHARLGVVFQKQQRPRAVTALADDHLSRVGYLANGKRVDVHLQPRHRNGRRFWAAVMRVTVHQRLFFDVNARWRDEEGCGGREDASWDFRLRRR